MNDLTVTIRGQEYPVRVDSNGIFHAEVSGQNLRASSLAELKAKGAKAMVKVDIPYTRWSEQWNTGQISITDGTFTGIHSDGRRLLAREGSNARQFGGNEGFLHRLSEDEKSEFHRLAEAKRLASNELGTFLRERRITDVHKLISYDTAKGGEDDGTDKEDS